MKTTGRYCSVTSYDLDHQITQEIEHMKSVVISGIDDNGDYENKKAIIKAMIQTLVDEL